MACGVEQFGGSGVLKITTTVHTDVMGSPAKGTRQSISLPANVATQVRVIAKKRRLSANRVLVELIENGLEAERRKERDFFELAERFRNAADPSEIKRLGNQMGRMLFGG